MRTIWSLLSIMLGILAALTAKASPTSNSLVITHATIIDVRNGQLLRDQTIVITGDRITSISHQPIEIPARAEVVNAAGKFVIPGLWDLHAHALWSTDQITRMFDLLLANEITGIRDMGSPLPLTETLGWRDKVANGSILGLRFCDGWFFFQAREKGH
jgi:predicted amidohydrolase